MPGEQPSDALTGSAIDQELGTMLAVDPSPAFLARVRARVADETATADGVFLPIGRTAAAAVIVALVVAGAVFVRMPPADPGPAPGSASNRARATIAVPYGGRLEPSPPPAVLRHAPSPSRQASQVMDVEAGQAPEVLVSATESDALRQLLAAGSAGRIRMEGWSAQARAARLSINPIVVPALVIEPLRLEEGASR